MPNVGWKITPKMLSNVMMIPMNSGTSVKPAAAEPTFSPCAAMNFSRIGNRSTNAALQCVIVGDALSIRLRILVTYGS